MEAYFYIFLIIPEEHSLNEYLKLWAQIAGEAFVCCGILQYREETRLLMRFFSLNVVVHIKVSYSPSYMAGYYYRFIIEWLQFKDIGYNHLITKSIMFCIYIFISQSVNLWSILYNRYFPPILIYCPFINIMLNLNL